MPDVADLLVELCAIPSPSRRERAVADRVAAELRAIGLEPEEDDTGPSIDGDTGTTLVRLPATPGEQGTPLFFCAHLDTVPLDGPLEPAIEDGFVVNRGGTILGADNKAAVVVMVQALRRIVAEGIPHAGIELVLTPQEENGLYGARAFDTSRLVARHGIVYDHAAPIGDVVQAAPSMRALDITFRGRKAHAGIAPEDGRSAIQAAAKAIAELRLGRVDARSTANVGTIEGGVARNIVPDRCRVVAEARSQDHDTLLALVQEMLDSIAFAAAVCDCEVETTVEEKYRGYRFAPDDPLVLLACSGLARAGATPQLVDCGGGADTNVFNARGLPCLTLANAMEQIHTPEERIAVDALEQMVEVTLALVDEARRVRL